MAVESILVVGGSGFVGRHVVNRLVDDGHKVVVPTRRQLNANEIKLLPTVDIVECDVNKRAELQRLVERATTVINLVGILNESGSNTFARAHVELPRSIVAACTAARVRRLIHMSALNADPGGPSQYLRSKGEGEAVIAGSGLDWTIFEPSVIFGPEDRFLNLFAKLLRFAPVLPLAGAQARFQPVYVRDVAECFARALPLDATFRQKYRICGPEIYTLRDLVRYVGGLTGASRPIFALGSSLARMQAWVLEHLPGTLMSRDNLASMAKDSVCGCEFPAIFGIAPQALEAVAPTYLGPAALESRYDRFRIRGGR
ncbi:MAG TPA: complex I NDUFA9 subunit family protein [Casimicrobiaceae bacterium]|nr:complex I NDUFA9 subunit family protein [Casimicrobiaceae bacterium]